MFKSGEKPEHPVALVTGGSGGLGQALVVELDRLGCHVAIHYNSSARAAEDVAGKLENPSHIVQADMSSEASVEAMINEVSEKLGPIDVLVNNAGIRKDNLMAMQTTQDWRDVIETNLLGTFYCSRFALPQMLRKRWGRIINVVSPSGLIASPGQTAYSASKAGIMGMTRTLAAECGRRGVTVNAMSPGFMITAMTEDLPEKVKEGMLEKLPIPRFTDGPEVAQSMAFFIDNAYVTGQTISIDGGIATT